MSWSVGRRPTLLNVISAGKGTDDLFGARVAEIFRNRDQTPDLRDMGAICLSNLYPPSRIGVLIMIRMEKSRSSSTPDAVLKLGRCQYL